MLRVDVAKQLGEFSLQVSFTSEGRVTGLFGASGAGKTSLVGMIAGLTKPDRGVIAIDGDVLDDIYRVDEVATDYIALTYLPLKMKQILSFREGAAASESGIAPTSPRDTTEPGERYRSLSSEAGADGGD